MNTTKEKSISLFGFFAITASMVVTVYEYPTFATAGFHLVFYLLLGGFLWFMPVTLCSAEMATVDGWESGGVFSWTGNTLGNGWGFSHIFFQWFGTTVAFINMLYFIVGAFSYAFNMPILNNNPIIKLITVLIIFWILTLIQLKGTKYTAKISQIGFIIGIVIPALILFILALIYILKGNPVHVVVNKHIIIPDFSKMNTLVVFVSFILAYIGAESSGPLVKDMKNPKKHYPLAIFLLIIMAILLDTFGGLTVATVVPLKEISLNTGIFQSFTVLTESPLIVRGLALLVALGVMAQVSAWVIGPSKGLLMAATHGILPKVFQKTNKKSVPVNLIMVQSIVVSIWAIILTLGSSGNNMSFLTAISLTVVIFLVGYILFFLAYLNLILKKNNLKRAYEIPGGKIVKLFLAISGLILSIFSIIISFVPPVELTGKNSITYEIILIIAFIITLIIPSLIYKLRKI